MKLLSKLILWMFLSLMLALGAKAAEVQASNALICGTAEQAKNFVATNQDLQRALTATVNDAAPTNSHCLVAGIAYVAGKQIERVEHHDGTYMVTEILIVGVATPYGMLAIEPSVVYTVLKVNEEAA
jgi:hypothetical protein